VGDRQGMVFVFWVYPFLGFLFVINLFLFILCSLSSYFMFIGWLLIEASEEGFGLWLALSLHLGFSIRRPIFLAASFIWGFAFYVSSFTNGPLRFLSELRYILKNNFYFFIFSRVCLSYLCLS
jgi:hypothetical protein